MAHGMGGQFSTFLITVPVRLLQGQLKNKLCLILLYFFIIFNTKISYLAPSTIFKTKWFTVVDEVSLSVTALTALI